MESQFDYAFRLVRSRYASDMRKGSDLLKDLCKKDIKKKGDYIFYLAVVHTRLREYEKALMYIANLENIAPAYPQIQILKEIIINRRNNDTATGKVVRAALLIGGMAGLGMWLLKR